jgi:hypothetical protein
MTTEMATAAKAILAELIKVAAQEGKAERKRLGRDLTKAEATNLAFMVERQFKTALAIATLR